MKARVVVTSNLPERALIPLYELGRVETWKYPSVMPRDLLFQLVQDASALLTSVADKIDADLLDRAPLLKVIANYGVGYDNIDVAVATSRGVVVTNTPDVVTEATADLTLALLLCIARRVVEAVAFTRDERWTGWDPNILVGTDVHGKTLGLLGLGRIGRAVARRAAGFGMKVLYYDVKRDVGAEASLGVEYAPFEAIFRSSDFVSLHVPLSPQNRHLVGARELQLMKSTAFLINTARGGIVDYTALADALTNRVIAGAAVDVLSAEPPKRGDQLLHIPNLLVTPHIGTATHETRYAMATVAVRSIVDVLQGRQPSNVVHAV